MDNRATLAAQARDAERMAKVISLPTGNSLLLGY